MIASAGQVRSRAGGWCEYCRAPQAAFRRQFHIEHIVAKQHDGSSQLDNLAFACWRCNSKKGPNLAGIDPQTGQMEPLFHPRKNKWLDHFALGIETFRPNGIEIQGLTAVGRATVRVLDLNENMQQMLRHQFWLEGLYGSGHN